MSFLKLSSKRTMGWIKFLLAAALLTGLFYGVDMHALKLMFLNLSWSAIGYLLFLSVVLIYISALKWGLFLESLGSAVSVVRLFGLYLVGYFVNLILPSYLGGDAVRSWYIGKQVGQHEALAATILERYTGLAAMLMLGVGSVWFVQFAPWQVRVAVVCAAFGLAIITVVALSRSLLDRLAKLPFMAGLCKHLARIQDSFRLVLKEPALLAKAFGLSLLYHMVTVVNTLAAAAAVGWTGAPVQDLFVVLPLILIIGALPITPSGIGLQEGAFYFFLCGIGATPEQALGVALILRAKSYVLAAVGGLCWLFERRIGRVVPGSIVPPVS